MSNIKYKENLLICLDSNSRWPSGDFVELAVINVDLLSLEKLFGRPLVEGDEPGLGHWRAIGGLLPSGRMMELISYTHSKTQGFTLRVDAASEFTDTLNEVMQCLEINQENVVWTNSLLIK